MTTLNGAATAPSQTAPRKLKILMLHGFTQSGPLFHAKTRALEKALIKAFPPQDAKSTKPTPGSLPAYPGGVALLYPSAPHSLSASDIPGYDPTSLASSKDNDWRAWWVKDETTGAYNGLDVGYQVIADTIAAEGPIDGVMGFSQGACGAALVASLLEPGRVEAFKKQVPNGGDEFPEQFLKDAETGEIINQGQQLKFAVSYSGFYAPNKKYAAYFEPKIQTPLLNFIGSLDTVVEEERSLGLIDRCENPTKVIHPGGHFVPIGKEWVNALIGFIRQTCGEQRKVEESVEDVDVPF